MSKKTLLIIGNGFDLKCGLKSQYVDYWYNQRFNHEHFNKFCEYLENNEYRFFEKDNLKAFDELIELEEGITFLDYYFTLYDWSRSALNKNKIWSNVEDVLLYGFSEVMGSYYFNFFYSFDFYQRAATGNSDLSFIRSYEILVMAKYLNKAFNGKVCELTNFHNYVLKELDKFSINFAKYIDNEANKKADYNSSAQKLITDITGGPIDECEIMSFNYTKPIVANFCANIHGLASQEKIVLGITCGDNEEKEAAHRKWFYKATKEYKIANISASGIKVCADYDDVVDIYVYGLSLGKQDYDFFDNLFDEFELLMRTYRAKLHFCYSTYGNKTIDEVADETTSRVATLINHFGDSHGAYGLLRSMIQKGHLLFKYIK